MNDGELQLTLRELRAHLTAPFVLAVQAGVAVILAASGPFGTFESLSLPLRFVYWPVIVFGTYGIGATITVLVLSPDDRPPPPAPGPVLRGTALIGLAVTVYLLMVNLAFFGWRGPGELFAPTAVFGAFLVSAVTLSLRELLLAQQAPLQPPPILQRLSPGKRGELIALSAQDHYVEVVTSAGSTLLLMPLRDAIRLTGGQPGLRVHRSHWVARSAVAEARRRGDGAVLTLTNGLEIPVSRGHMGAARRAGLIAGPQSVQAGR